VGGADLASFPIVTAEEEQAAKRSKLEDRLHGGMLHDPRPAGVGQVDGIAGVLFA
jgi:hypothetical protein